VEFSPIGLLKQVDNHSILFAHNPVVTISSEDYAKPVTYIRSTIGSEIYEPGQYGQGKWAEGRYEYYKESHCDDFMAICRGDMWWSDKRIIDKIQEVYYESATEIRNTYQGTAGVREGYGKSIYGYRDPDGLAPPPLNPYDMDDSTIYSGPIYGISQSNESIVYPTSLAGPTGTNAASSDDISYLRRSLVVNNDNDTPIQINECRVLAGDSTMFELNPVRLGSLVYPNQSDANTNGASRIRVHPVVDKRRNGYVVKCANKPCVKETPEDPDEPLDPVAHNGMFTYSNSPWFDEPTVLMLNVPDQSFFSVYRGYRNKMDAAISSSFVNDLDPNKQPINLIRESNRILLLLQMIDRTSITMEPQYMRKFHQSWMLQELASPTDSYNNVANLMVRFNHDNFRFVYYAAVNKLPEQLAIGLAVSIAAGNRLSV
jgi:hypothetical protein